jgi:hypothetical protein
MSFDISRKTFDAWKNYFGVVMQQGRVQMDSDWNEWLSELARRMQAGTLDILGVAGVPSTTPSGFKIRAYFDTSMPPVPHVTFDVGRAYVDGILVENHAPKGTDQWDPALNEWSASPQPLDYYTQQPYYPGVPPIPGGGPFLFYLDVWQREVTYLEDPSLVDKAVGIDTTGRYQTVWQVKFRDVSSVAGASCSTSIDDWNTLIQPSAGQLTTGIGGAAAVIPGPCSLSATAGYTGLENQLYRVEIHEPASPTATATFKWSRNNGIVTTGVTAISGSVLTVQSLGRDQMLAFLPGNWIEITDDSHELNGQPGNLCQIDSIDSTANTITLVSPPGFTLSQPDLLHTRITRWDQAGSVYQSDGTVYPHAADSSGIQVPPSGTALILENGITVAFDLATPGGPLRTGDFWIFAARTADGSVETLTKAPPFGIYHHYCRLSIVDFTGATPIVSDCRRLFPSLANPAIHVTGVLIGGNPLPNNGVTTLTSLASGIAVVCDLPVDPAIITQPTPPICSLTVDVSDAASAGGWFTPVVLSAVVAVAGNTITWIPSGPAITALTNLPPGPPLLARLTLKGNAIWAADNPNIYLNGAADGRPYADFGMWFQLIAQPLVSSNPEVLNFGTQQVSTPSTPQTVTVINNPLNKPLTIAISGDFTQTNTSVPAAAPNTIPPGATCTISVTFTPSTTNGSAGQISFTGSADGSVSMIQLTGSGVPAPELYGPVPPVSLGFVAQQINTKSTTPMQVTVTGNSQLAVTGIALFNTDGAFGDADFTCDPSGVGDIPPLQNGQGTINVWFTPTALGLLQANLRIAHNAPGSPLLVALSGQGTPAALPTVLVTLPTLTNPATKKSVVGMNFYANGALTAQLTNQSSSESVIFEAPDTTEVPGSFSVTSNNCGTLAPGATCGITVRYFSAISVSQSGTLKISHNGANPPVSIDLESFGTA